MPIDVISDNLLRPMFSTPVLSMNMINTKDIIPVDASNSMSLDDDVEFTLLDQIIDLHLSTGEGAGPGSIDITVEQGISDMISENSGVMKSVQDVFSYQKELFEDNYINIDPMTRDNLPRSGDEESTSNTIIAQLNSIANLILEQAETFQQLRTE